jgi:hypothetical protein
MLNGFNFVKLYFASVIWDKWLILKHTFRSATNGVKCEKNLWIHLTYTINQEECSFNERTRTRIVVRERTPIVVSFSAIGLQCFESALRFNGDPNPEF